MGSLLSYSGLSTKIRAMQHRLIDIPQFQEISQMTSVPQVVAYLKKQPGFENCGLILTRTPFTWEKLNTC